MNNTTAVIAAKLDGMTYDEVRRGIPMQIRQEAQYAGCVIICGMSDDILDFSGAINDELGAYEGTKAYIRNGRLIQPKCEECKECGLYEDQIKQARVINALWDHMGYSWFITVSEGYYSCFVIYEDGETFCRGIVIEV